jgi:hypothetical protein
MNSVLGTVLLVLLIALAVFLIFREFFTWYWKQTEIVNLLKSIDYKLEKLSQHIPDDEEDDEKESEDDLNEGNR